MLQVLRTLELSSQMVLSQFSGPAWTSSCGPTSWGALNHRGIPPGYASLGPKGATREGASAWSLEVGCPYLCSFTERLWAGMGREKGQATGWEPGTQSSSLHLPMFWLALQEAWGCYTWNCPSKLFCRNTCESERMGCIILNIFKVDWETFYHIDF